MLLVFLFRRLTLFFRFTFVHTSKLKRSNFLNDFFLSLTAFARVTSFLTLSSKSFLRDKILIISDLPHSIK